MKVIEFYSFVMNPAARFHNADNNINWDGPDDKTEIDENLRKCTNAVMQ
jgi:hypothetical protein